MPLAVAHIILTAHDATELALAAIATATGAEVKKDQPTLMDYPGPIAAAKRGASAIFEGRPFLDQLNRVRRDLKHAGVQGLKMGELYCVAVTAVSAAGGESVCSAESSARARQAD